VRRYDQILGEWVSLALVGQDAGADTITVRFDHFSEIALLGPLEYRLYLPIVLR
jgi:hypothetical protein